MRQELVSILDYWMEYTVDRTGGGFAGRVDQKNKVDAGAPKGSVLNSRILWTFSAAFELIRDHRYQAMAERAFEYLDRHFVDKEYGGVFWTVDAKGNALDTKKQIYALSFAVYGLSEYYRISKNESSLDLAKKLYSDLVKHSYDEKNGGYIEALSREWKELTDLRLSDKDANERKSMNTHLHVLEAFANLCRIWPAEQLKQQIGELITVFLEHIISKDTGHLLLFFNDQWHPRSALVSYGHDIEAAWLIQEAAERIGKELLLIQVKNASIRLADAAAKGLDKDGGLWYEYDADTRHLVKQKHSWPQAEAMVGFFNAWQITGDLTYLHRSLASWEFVKNYIRDKEGGEWHWGVEENYFPMSGMDKVGIWKCPYHNSRACIEIITRINTILNKDQSYET